MAIVKNLDEHLFVHLDETVLFNGEPFRETDELPFCRHCIRNIYSCECFDAE